MVEATAREIAESGIAPFRRDFEMVARQIPEAGFAATADCTVPVRTYNPRGNW